MELDIRPSGPHKIDQELALNGTRERGATETFRDVLTNLRDLTDSTIHVFDVGANVGYYTLLEADVLGQQGRIYAIEAEPDNAGRLERNIELNGYTNVSVHRIAAGAERSQQELSVRSGANVHRMTSILEDKEPVGTVPVEVVPIDDLIDEQNIDEHEPIVVKIDVEGYEPYVFEGMNELLRSKRPVYVMVEIHPDRDHFDVADIVRPLRENGFEPEYISYDGGTTIEPTDSFDEMLDIDRVSIVLASRINDESMADQIEQDSMPDRIGQDPNADGLDVGPDPSTAEHDDRAHSRPINNADRPMTPQAMIPKSRFGRVTTIGIVLIALVIGVVKRTRSGGPGSSSDDTDE